MQSHTFFRSYKVAEKTDILLGSGFKRVVLEEEGESSFQTAFEREGDGARVLLEDRGERLRIYAPTEGGINAIGLVLGFGKKDLVHTARM